MAWKRLRGATQHDNMGASVPEPLHASRGVADGGDQDAEDQLLFEQLDVACLAVGVLTTVAGQHRELPISRGVLNASYDAALARVPAGRNDDSDGGAGSSAQLLRRGVTDIAELTD